MLFPTLEFALFFIFIFSVSWIVSDRSTIRKSALLLSSYVFYAFWDWRFCFLLIFASLVAWLAGIMLGRNQNLNQRKYITGFSCAILLSVLAVFKYYGFFTESLGQLLSWIGFQRDLPLLQIVLPVGISFFTFQAISYVIDVHTGKLEARKSPLDLLLYISFFPQLVAGPIVRASHFLPQLDRKPFLSRTALVFGLSMCVLGLFKKMVVANYLATDLVDPVFFDPEVHSSGVLLIAIYGYAAQIYCDFSGYSDIAIGTAALLGFRFRPNFNQPYRASSIQEFWRRWHISLSQWLRDYLYKPLGGSRFSNIVTVRNLMLTMLLGGLWHGAAWNFVLWGALHGVGLVLGRSLSKYLVNLSSGLWLAIKIIATFHFVCVGWILFRSENITIAYQYFVGLLNFDFTMEGVGEFSLFLIILTMVSQFLPAGTLRSIAYVIHRQPIWVLAAIFSVSMLVIDLVSPPGTAPFIYFQF